MRGVPYTDAERSRLVKLYLAGVSRADMATALDRSNNSIDAAIEQLREDGRIGLHRVSQFRSKAHIGHDRPEKPVTLRDDGLLVERTIAEVGFPVAVIGQGWRNLSGKPWIHTPDEDRRAA